MKQYTAKYERLDDLGWPYETEGPVYLAADVEQALKQILEPFVQIIEAKAISQMIYEVPEEKHSDQMILDCMPSGLVEPWKQATRLLERLR